MKGQTCVESFEPRMNCVQDAPVTTAIARLLSHLGTKLPPRAIVTDPDAIAPWLTDWRGRYHGAARAMLEPTDTAEVAAIVAAAADCGVPLVPQGGNTSMVGGATPPADGSAAILSLRRMNRIRAIEPGMATVEAGVILATLHAAAVETGQRFPLSLGAKGSATIGGLVSTNAGGTQVLRFGTMRALTLGVEAVLPDGSIYDGLAALRKDNRGYDLGQLLCGAEGTLGVVIAARLRLVPACPDRLAVAVACESWADAVMLASRARRDVDGLDRWPCHLDGKLRRRARDARTRSCGAT